jgi:DNA repair protein RecO (recombination protein O)
MGDYIEVTGIVLSAMPVGEFDRRIELLTKERGRISAFAKGARKQNSALTGVTRAFVFGTFQLYEGRTSYTVKQASITNYFQEIISDLDCVYYGCYFAELAEYYSREGVDGADMINLLYASLKALAKKNIPNRLVRYIYEIRLVFINGECPDFFESSWERVNESTLHALQVIVTAPVNRLYTFTLSDECLNELGSVASGIIHTAVDKRIKSEELLE